MSEQKLRELRDDLVADINHPERGWGIHGHSCVDDDYFAALRYVVDRMNEALAQQPIELTDEELIKFALDSGFERNTLGWTFTHGRLDYHLLKFARATIASYEAKKNGGVV